VKELFQLTSGVLMSCAFQSSALCRSSRPSCNCCTRIRWIALNSRRCCINKHGWSDTQNKHNLKQTYRSGNSRSQLLTVCSSLRFSLSPSDPSKTLNIQIVSDNICPFCYLGKKKVEAAVAKLPKDVKVTYDWQPFQLDPTLPTPGVNKMERYKKKFGEARIAPMLAGMQANGKAWGINFDYGGTIGNTVNSHRLVEFSKTPAQGGGAKTDALIDALFQSYFEKQGDISSEDVLVAAAVKAGLPATEAEIRTFLRSDALKDEVLKEIQQSYEAGVSGVPHFTINGQYSVSGAQEPDVFLNVFKKAGIKTE
jgi:predicted DsbA family dithiol-disulfide isomerase